MTTGLAIDAPGRAPGNRDSGSTHCPPQPLPREAIAVPPVGRLDPTDDDAVPGRSASRAYRRRWRSHYGWVEGIVTMGTIIGFTVAPVLMAGEWLGGQVASLTQTIATTVAPAADPTVAAGPAIEPCAGSRPL